MTLASLSLTNFRTYRSLDLALSPNATLLVGDNATGKTNFLEAVYCLTITKSFRAELDREMICWGETIASLEGTVVGKERESTLRIVLEQQEETLTKKYLFVNAVAKRSTDYYGNLAVVLFAPHDVELVTSAPALRRHHLDLFLAQVSPEYKRAITNYAQVLRQRNHLLETIREGKARVSELDYWDVELVTHAHVISSERQLLFDFISGQEKFLGPIDIIYRPRLIDREELARLRGRDNAAGVTTAGPHRDDFVFLQSGKDLARYGARGEQRTAVLSLKLWELGFMRKVLGEPSVLLLDDIFSELDHTHRQHVLEILPHQQTIMTTTDLHLVDKKFRDQLAVLLVKQGNVTKP